MSYITDLANAIRDRIPDGLLPEGDSDSLFLMYAVLALAKGNTTTCEDVHNAWAAWMATIDPNHESIVEFESLERGVRAEDQPYVDAIHAAASTL